MRASFQDGRMRHSSRDLVGDYAVYPYTNPYICQDEHPCAQEAWSGRDSAFTVSASLKGVPEGLVEAAEPKPIAGGFRPGGHGAATVQQQLGLLAEHQSK